MCVTRQSVFGGKGSEPAVLESGEPTVCANPQASFSVLVKDKNKVILYLLGVCFIEHGEPCTIEPNQPLFSPQPEVSILRLGNRENAVLRQTILGSPYVVSVLCNGFPGIERERWSIPQTCEQNQSYRQARAVANQSMLLHRESLVILTREPVHCSNLYASAKVVIYVCLAAARDLERRSKHPKENANVSYLAVSFLSVLLANGARGRYIL